MTTPTAPRTTAADPTAVRRRWKCRACGHLKRQHARPLLDGRCGLCECLGWDPMTADEWEAAEWAAAYATDREKER